MTPGRFYVPRLEKGPGFGHALHALKTEQLRMFTILEFPLVDSWDSVSLFASVYT